MSVLSSGVRNGAAAAGSTNTTFDDVRDVITYQPRDGSAPAQQNCSMHGFVRKEFIVNHTIGSLSKPAAALVSGALAVGTLLVPGLVSAPAAHATCISAFGFGNSAECTSTVSSVAIAIGANAQAHADGILGAALAFGSDSTAQIDAGSAVNLAATVGQNSSAASFGFLSAAISTGSDASVYAGSPSETPQVANLSISLGNNLPVNVGTLGIGNVAVNLLSDGATAALGNFNSALTVGGSGQNGAQGYFSSAVKLLSNNTRVLAGGSVETQLLATASFAFSAFGNDNFVKAGPGPLAIAGSIGQTGATIRQPGPGININQPSVDAAAVRRHRVPPAASSAKAAGTPRSASVSRSRAR